MIIQICVGSSCHIKGSRQVVNALQKLIAEIREDPIRELASELNIADPDNLYLVAHTGMQILLGDEERLPEKFVWARAVHEELQKKGVTRGVLDVSSGKNAVYAAQ